MIVKWFAKKALKELQDKIAERDIKIETLKSTIEELEDENHKMKKHIIDAAETVKECRAEISTLNNKLYLKEIEATVSKMHDN